jgi:nucleoporin NUP2
LEEDGLARTQSPGLHGGEGEGEEDEETTYTVKAKVFKFTTDREGAPTWSDMGIGMLRLKKHKENNTRRIILRANNTGKIVINFRIYPGLQPKRTGKAVAFTGHITSPGKDTQSVQYRLRVSTEQSATELVEAIEHEVRLVQANSSPST